MLAAPGPPPLLGGSKGSWGFCSSAMYQFSVLECASTGRIPPVGGLGFQPPEFSLNNCIQRKLTGRKATEIISCRAAEARERGLLLRVASKREFGRGSSCGTWTWRG